MISCTNTASVFRSYSDLEDKFCSYRALIFITVTTKDRH